MNLTKFIFLISAVIPLYAAAVAAQTIPETGTKNSTHGSSIIGSPVRPALTLSDAMAIARTSSPRVMAATYQQQADKARDDSKLDGTPNPELSVAAEDFLGNGVAHGGNALQVTTAISQEVELGKKAESRKKIRSSNRELSGITQTLVLQNVLSDVAMAFLAVLAQQERLFHAREMVRLSQQTVDTIAAQVEAGRSTGMEQEKAAVELSLARLNESDAIRALDSAKVTLAAACGKDTVFFTDVTGSLSAVSELPVLEDLLTKMRAHPALLAANAKIRQQQALADSAKAGRIPNITVELGFRWNNASDNRAMVAGFGIPLPVWDRNRGDINASAKEILRAETEMDAQQIDLVKEITTSHQSLAHQLQRLRVLQNDISPSVKNTFTAVEEGYRIGRFGYLDLLDAQRTLFDVNNMVLEALVHYHASRITLNRTAGLPVPEKLFSTSAMTQLTSEKEKP